MPALRHVFNPFMPVFPTGFSKALEFTNLLVRTFLFAFFLTCRRHGPTTNIQGHIRGMDPHVPRRKGTKPELDKNKCR